MEKEFLSNMIAQNKVTCGFAFDSLSDENIDFRLNEKAASAGFMYRHIGETMNLFGTFFGEMTDVQNTTMGQTDTGQGKDLEQSKKMVRNGYEMMQKIVEKNGDALWWLEEIDTPFFGKVPRIRLFSHILYHNAHHAGQISLTLSKGTKY